MGVVVVDIVVVVVLVVVVLVVVVLVVVVLVVVEVVVAIVVDDAVVGIVDVVVFSTRVEYVLSSGSTVVGIRSELSSADNPANSSCAAVNNVL